MMNRRNKKPPRIESRRFQFQTEKFNAYPFRDLNFSMQNNFTTLSVFSNTKTRRFSESFYRERLAFWRRHSLRYFDEARRRRCCFCHRGWDCPTFEIGGQFICSRDLKMALRIADAWRLDVSSPTRREVSNA